jgi:CDP-diacylglycerol--serine O-phosphatidyltransferase
LIRIARGPRADLRQAVADGQFPLAHFLPSGITLVGLCCGATAIRFAMSGDWRSAVAAIVFAAIFDLLDGGVARMLGTDSAFGAQLDSLADLVSFGIAPAVIVYNWSLYHAGGAGWAMVLLFCTCCAVRLARFMIESPETSEAEERHTYFTGVPTPAAACLIMLPMLLSFQFRDPILTDPFPSMAMVALTSMLMISRVPTPSLKGIHVSREARGPILAFVGVLLGFAILWPWSTLTVSLVAYLVSIPATAVSAREDE